MTEFEMCLKLNSIFLEIYLKTRMDKKSTKDPYMLPHL